MRRRRVPIKTSQDGVGRAITDDHDARSRILETTLRLLGEHGYADLTTERIASLARVSKTTIYRFWRSKQELVVEAARRRFHPLDVPDLGSFRREVEFVLESRMADYRQSGALTLVAGLVGAASADPLLEEAFESWVHQLDLTLRQIIRRGVQRGDVRADVGSRVLESLIAGVVARSVITQRPFGRSATGELAALLADAVRPQVRVIPGHPDDLTQDRSAL